MSVDSKIDEIESARNTIRSKMVAAGQASSSDKLADLANNLTFEKYYSTDDTAETTIADDDYFPFYDASATAKRKSLWSNIKSKLKTYFDTLYPSKTTVPDPTSDDSGKFLRGDGSWQKIEAGGGHTIEDPEGTALTQRDTLQFGGDLEVSDDGENEKTVVAPHELTTEELTEIMSTLPGQPTQGITIDLRGNEQVVGKVIETDGTEKTLYQKTFNNVTPTDGQITALLTNIDKVFDSSFIRSYSSGATLAKVFNDGNNVTNGIVVTLKNNSVYLEVSSGSYNAGAGILTIRYTKTS